MSAPSASTLSVEVLLPVIDVKYGCFKGKRRNSGVRMRIPSLKRPGLVLPLTNPAWLILLEAAGSSLAQLLCHGGTQASPPNMFQAFR